MYATDGALIAEAPLGNRKDIRNAVEAARKAEGWAKATAHNRAQVLYFLAENASQRSDDLATSLAHVMSKKQAEREVACAIERIFSYAAWTDKFEGTVHKPPMRNVTLAMREPIGTVGIICPPEAPLLALLSLVLPAVAMGNTVIAVPFRALSAYHWPAISAFRYQRFAWRSGKPCVRPDFRTR